MKICFITLFVHFGRERIVAGFPEVGELIRYLYSEINFLCADVLYNFKLFDFPGEMDLVALISSVPFVLVDWFNLSDENLLHCFIFVHIRRNGLSLDAWKLVSLFVIYTQSSLFYVLLFCLISNYVWLPGEMDLVALISSLPFVDLLIDCFTHGLWRAWYLLCLCSSSSIQFCGPLFLQLRLPFQFWVFH